jgi:hypothetical protein
LNCGWVMSWSYRSMICDSTSVELLRWESSDLWMHSELNCKHSLIKAWIKKSLEETSAIPSLFRVAWKSGSWELFLISY